MVRDYKFSNKNFFIRILLPTVLTIILFVAVFFIVIIPQFETTIMDRKREMIRELTNSAHSILEKWYQAEKYGEVTRQEAQDIAVEEIESLRYGDEGKDYFWITDYAPVMIMHPYRPDLNNEDLSGITDSHGKLLFSEMAEVAKKDGEGFVDYMWQWKDIESRVVPKLSYVKAFKPWQWVIGTGIYLEDVREEISELEQQIITISLIITGVIAVLLIFIAYQNLTTERQRQRAESELHESRERYRTLVEASTEGLIMIVEGGRIFYNRMMHRLLGYDYDVQLPPLHKLFIEPPDLQAYDSAQQIITDTEFTIPDQSEAIIRKADDKPLRVLINASRISLFDRRGVVLSVKDLTLSDAPKTDSIDGSTSFTQLAERLSTGVFRVNAKKDFRIIELNQAAKKIWNISDNDAVLKIPLKKCFAHAADYNAFCSDVLEEGLVLHRTAAVPGDTVMSVSAVATKSETDDDVYIDGIVEDITVKRKLEDEQLQLIGELENAFLFLNKPAVSLAKPLPECTPDMPAIDALNVITNENSDCLLIVDSSGRQLGFLSESDIRSRILESRENLDEPVHTFMSAPLIAVNTNTDIFTVMGKLYQHNVRHILLRNEKGLIDRVITAGDLQHYFHASYLFFIRKIEEARSISDLTGYYQRLMLLVRGMIEIDAGSEIVLKLIADISDPIFTRVIELAVDKLGKPPVDFAFILLGSAGRSEQTLATDQDNAIIYDDCEGQAAEEAATYFKKLGEKAAADLNSIGFKYCKGEIMASNPKWCQPFEQWKKYFTEWVTTAEPKDLLDIKIFFDFRQVYGGDALTDKLQEHITRITSGYNPFFVYFAENIIGYQVPDEAVKLKSPFDIKKVMLPLVDAMRLYGLKKKVNDTNTLVRLRMVFKQDALSDTLYNNAQQAYTFLMQKRLQHQTEQISRGMEADNLIRPAELTDIETAMLKKAVSIIQDLQAKLNVDFKGTISV